MQLGKVWVGLSNYYIKKYRGGEDKKHLDSASYYIGYSNRAVEIIRSQLYAMEDKQNIIKSQRVFSAKTTAIAAIKSKIENTVDNANVALNAMESNKSIILQDALKEQDISTILNLPEDTQLEKRKLEKSISLLQKEIIDAKAERNENLLFDLEEELFEKETGLKKK